MTIGCGTIIGNGLRDPTTPSPSPIGLPPPPTAADFQLAIDEYNDSGLDDCGSFTEDSSISELDTGRLCIIDADETCTPKKYLYNKTNTDGSRFVSFVSVISDSGNCSVRVHTVSSVSPQYLQDTRTCEEFTEGEIPEVACGILN